MIDDLQVEIPGSTPDQREKAAQFFAMLRNRVQGLAAVVYRATVESGKLREDGAAIAQPAATLLRFLSPAALHFPAVSANDLLGTERVPVSNLLVLGEGSISFHQALLAPNAPDWRLSESDLARLQPALEVIGRLVTPDGLSGFARTVRSSILLFGTGAAFHNPIERLSYALSALEALFLRHSAEAAEFNTAERMALLLGVENSEREEIMRNVREAYRLRARQDLSPLGPLEMQSTATFLRRAHNVIGAALDNIEKFADVNDFISAVEVRRTPQS